MKPLFAAFAAFVICAAPLHADPTPKPKPKVTAASQLPFGIQVPGKPNLVYSPYAKGKIIDVAPPTVVGGRTVMIRMKRGQLVLCPYTGKTFRVP
jgi:hypothetical protein